ncbi:protein-tyrosine phosphatase [Kribbella kalugense]|uniref:Protein-tyrosine phosphatase n=1 Tax=Kribbella kalugense TaxID=2512221 RepID=A0A4R7ZND2_9ACTN|nr:protein-tyrosine phosphatase [Kribbella kalugense]
MMELPSGRLVRGRSLRRSPAAAPFPTYGVYLTSTEPPDVPWETHWIKWPDFRLPTDRPAALTTFREALEATGTGRVEFACDGGRGRTGTALACLAVLDGLRADQAVDYVRRHYDKRAVETPWQKRYVLNLLTRG